MTQLATRELAEQEAIIKRNLQGFVNVGSALQRIKRKELYTVEYDTFEKYCKARWGFDRDYARRLIVGAEVTDHLRTLPIGSVALPITETQARPLTKLEPDEQPVAWELALEKAGDGDGCTSPRFSILLQTLASLTSERTNGRS